MGEAIITALVTGVVTLAVCLINNHYQKKESDKKHDEAISLIDYKISELTKKVEKHNNLVERMYHLEEVSSVQAEQIKVANHRIDDLERKG